MPFVTAPNPLFDPTLSCCAQHRHALCGPLPVTLTLILTKSSRLDKIISAMLVQSKETQARGYLTGIV